MATRLNHKNKEWMQFFNENRNLWQPIASEWKRLSVEYLENYVQNCRKK